MGNINKQGLCVTNEEVIKLCCLVKETSEKPAMSLLSVWCRWREAQKIWLIGFSLAVLLCSIFLKNVFDSLLIYVLNFFSWLKRAGTFSWEKIKGLKCIKDWRRLLLGAAIWEDYQKAYWGLLLAALLECGMFLLSLFTEDKPQCDVLDSFIKSGINMSLMISDKTNVGPNNAFISI